MTHDELASKLYNTISPTLATDNQKSCAMGVIRQVLETLTIQDLLELANEEN